jgi:hypothetical protein
VANFGLAVNQRVKADDGTWQVAPSLRWAIAQPERADRTRTAERGSGTERGAGQFNDPPPF